MTATCPPRLLHYTPVRVRQINLECCAMTHNPSNRGASLDDATSAEWDHLARLQTPNTPQPAPQHSNHPAAWSLVIADMAGRDVVGSAKYGTRLRPGNGRDNLIDAYQEALDLVVYLRAAIYERDEALSRGGV